jgi:hypothetical protein
VVLNDRTEPPTKRAHLASCVAVILAVWCAGNTAFGADTAAVYRAASPSVCLITSMDAYGQPLGLGSGFVADDAGSVLTNFHVIEGAASVHIRFPSGSVHQITNVVAYDTAQDMALLASDATEIQPLSLGTGAVEIGTPIFAIGNPAGLESTLSTGIVSGVRTFGDGTRFYQITAPISPGSSGGPVLNEDGHVIGIATATLAVGQNLNFAVPITTTGLRALRDTAPTTMRLTSIVSEERPERDEARERGLICFDAEADMHHPTYGGSLGGVSFSISSGLPYPVTDVRLLIVYYLKRWRNSDGPPVPSHFLPVKVSRTIPPNLGIRVWVDDDTSYSELVVGDWRAEFRILDWKILPASAGAFEFKEAE